jgi:formate dehydrogenase major subunit
LLEAGKRHLEINYMVHITLNGQPQEVPPGTTVLNAARAAGIVIPTLCAFEHLLPYGGCRLCVVEVDGARIMQPSCTLPVNEGMVVHTHTPRLEEARKFILNMLFSERNHFCMFCQVSGGDCELQNAALDLGLDHWPLQPNWDTYPVDASHPYFILDNNRCILCKRCIRACGELVGNFTLGAAERGAQTLVVADNDVPFGSSSCIRCGTCVSVCPTGALIDRQSAYLGKVVDSEITPSVCIGCSVGCGTELVTRDNLLLKINGDWNSTVNAGLLCELGRFIPMHDNRQRILSPMIRKDGSLKAATWGEALATIAVELKQHSGINGSGIAALASTRLSAEALALFKELFAVRLQSEMTGSTEEIYTTPEQVVSHHSRLYGNLSDLRQADCVVALGVDLYKNHQVAGFFIKRNLVDQTQLIVIDPAENQMDTQALFSLKPRRGTDAQLLLGLMAGISELELARKDFSPSLDLNAFSPARVSETTGVPVEALLNASRAIGMAAHPIFVIGKGLTGQNLDNSLNPQNVLAMLAQLTNGRILSPGGKANSLAAVALGLNNLFEPGGRKAAFIALGDDQISQRQIQALEEVPFLAVQASYHSPLTDMADVVLPVEIWSEQEGHYLNMEGRLQATHRGLDTPEGIRSNVKVLNDIADVLGFELVGDWESSLQPYLALEPAGI